MRASITAIATGLALAIFCFTALVMQPMRPAQAHANQNCILVAEASTDYVDTMRTLGEYGIANLAFQKPAEYAKGNSKVMDAVDRLYRSLESAYDGPLSDREKLKQVQLRKYHDQCMAHFR